MTGLPPPRIIRPKWILSYRQIFQILAIVAASCWIFSPAWHGGWIGDDNLYITGNPLLKDPARLWKAWFQPGSFVEYYPLQESLQWLEWKIFGDQTLGYHLVNTALHVTSSLLIWRLLAKFGLRWGWLGGLIFAVHPILVESVCLINEFKTVLALPPFLLAMSMWMDFEESGKRRYYFLALLLFTVAMFCKIILAPFPFVILLFAWWKRGRIGWRDLGAMAPFLAISLILVFATMEAGEAFGHISFSSTSREALLTNGPDRSMATRLALVGTTLVFYFSRCFWPSTPLTLYPEWDVSHPTLPHLVPWLAMISIFFWLWLRRNSWGRHALLGLGYFSLMVGPFLGFTWISYMNATWVIDHFLYVPIVGIIGLTVAGLEDFTARLPKGLEVVGAVLVAGILGLLAFTSHSYAAQFVTEEQLCRYTINHNPLTTLARYNLGVHLMDDHKVQEAIEQFQITLRIDPHYSHAADNLGAAFVAAGRLDDAIKEFKNAEQIDPHDPLIHFNLAHALLLNGDTEEAIAECQEALRCNESKKWRRYEYSFQPTIENLKQFAEEMEENAQAIALHPDDPSPHIELGNALLQIKRSTEAITQFKQALELDPISAKAHYGYGHALLIAGDRAEAIRQLQLVVDLDPNFSDIHIDLGTALVESGRSEEALSEYQKAVLQNPKSTQIHNALGNTLVKLGRISEGQAEFTRALQIDPTDEQARENLSRLSSSKD